MNTHSSAADGRMEVLGAWGGALGASSERICRILEAVTVEQALFVLDETPGLLEAVMSRVMERVEFHLKREPENAFRQSASYLPTNGEYWE